MSRFHFVFVLTLAALGAYADAADAGDDLAKEKQLSAEYLARMVQEPGAQVIEQGVVLRPIFVSASQEFPKLTDTVKVSYLLADREGKLIEESLRDDALAEFPLNRLIRCWQIALPKMAVGSFYKVTCPSDTAYGDRGVAPDIKPGAALSFRVTLFGLSAN